MTEEGKTYIRYSDKNSLMPKEETLERKPEKKTFIIGIPRESDPNESRVPLAPMAVGVLVKNGHRVLVEENAGKAAYFPDNQYAEAGAEIVHSIEEVYKSNMIVKISAPTDEEIDLMDKGQTLFSSVSLQGRSKNYFQKLLNKKVNAVAYEYIKDKAGAFPLVKSMSEIIGNAAIMIAAEYLCHSEYGKGIMLGGFPGVRPSEVVIIGAGTVAEYAARTALGMGAQVKIFDDSIYKMRELQYKLGNRVFTAVLQPPILEKAIKEADAVIGAKHSLSGQACYMVPKEMIMEMKQGAVIVDVSIDQGGCFETSRQTTHTHPVYKEFGVTHYCVPNIASRVPHTASYSLSNFLMTLLLDLTEAGGIENLIRENKAFGKGVYVYSGILTNEFIGDKYGLSFRDLDLILSALH
ncbi:MAG: alanine dehydrogenase [Bacteroidales bacterium]|nr:alanine dehydrogenase [Bacteroidales bacterium]